MGTSALLPFLISIALAQPGVVAPINAGAPPVAPAPPPTGQPPAPSPTPPNWTVSPIGQPPNYRPITPGNCPPGVLPQYCSAPPLVAPYICPVGNVQCAQQMQNRMALGCEGGPYQHMCTSRIPMPGQGLLFGRPPMFGMSPMPPRRQNQNGLQKIMPLLNALSGMMGGGGASEPTFSGGERMAITDGSGATAGYSGPDVSPGNLNARSSRGHAKIVEPFQKYFQRCTESLGLGTCSFKNLGIWGDPAHQARRSCHNSGEAIDVGLPFNCSQGGSFNATDPRAMEVAKCMATNADEQLGVIFRDETPVRNMYRGSPRGAHHGHMHIQLRNCNNVRG